MGVQAPSVASLSPASPGASGLPAERKGEATERSSAPAGTAAEVAGGAPAAAQFARVVSQQWGTLLAEVQLSSSFRQLFQQ